MALDKVLNRIQMQIKELAPTLELFIDESIQPSVKDCEALQQQIAILQENLAIYKYHKQEKELSPSFNIHAKVSEKEEERKKSENEKEEERKRREEERRKSEKEKEEKEKHQPDQMVLINDEPVIKASALTIGINDKFRFINELFKQNAGEYNIAAEQLNAVRTWNEAEVYLNSLKELYGWQDKNEVVVYFYSVVKKRFT